MKWRDSKEFAEVDLEAQLSLQAVRATWVSVRHVVAESSALDVVLRDIFKELGLNDGWWRVQSYIITKSG